MNPPRILIVGCGAVAAASHAPALLELQAAGDLSVTALYDPNPHRVTAMLRHFPGARLLPSIDRVDSGWADLALVASPVKFHREQAIRCLESGLAVLCEKPLAVTGAEAEAMVRAAEAAEKLFAVGLIRRFFATTQFIRQVIAERRFGRLQSFHACEGGRFSWDAASPSFFQKEAAGGGVLIDAGAHSLDLLLWWLGEPRAIDYEDDAMGGVEANCRLRMDYGEFRGEVHLTRDYNLRNGFRLDFEQAWIYWPPYSANRLQIGYRGSRWAHECNLSTAPAADAAPWRFEPAPPYEGAFTHQWRNVVRAMNGTEALRVPAREAVRSIGFIERCYRSRKLWEAPWFGEGEIKRARELAAGSRP